MSVSDDKRAGSSSAFRVASSSRFSSVDVASRSEARPARRLGPCFKISSLLFSFYWLCFYFIDYGVTLRPQSNILNELLYFILTTRLVQNMKISAVRSLADICFLHVLFGILILLFN